VRQPPSSDTSLSKNVCDAQKRTALDVGVDRKIAGAGQRVGFKATGTIDRRDFGMNSGYPVISEVVHLIVTTEVVGEP
jgi:polyisoprenoid-binding protein YceI